MKPFKLLALMVLGLNSFAIHAACTEPVIPVHMYILSEDNGQGNDHWKQDAYTDPMIKFINEKMLVSGGGELKIVSKKIIRDSRDYHSSQKSLVKRYKGLRKTGAITVVISREIIVDTGGRANGVSYEKDPMFVMRSRNYELDPKSPQYVWKPQNIEASGRLFVHELAHQMNLEHQGEKSKYSFHTENFTTVAAGKKHYEKYMADLVKASGYRCTSGGSSGSGSGAGSVVGGIRGGWGRLFQNSR